MEWASAHDSTASKHCSPHEGAYFILAAEVVWSSCFLSHLALLPAGLKSLPSEGKPHSCFLLTAVRLVSKE